MELIHICIYNGFSFLEWLAGNLPKIENESIFIEKFGYNNSYLLLKIDIMECLVKTQVGALPLLLLNNAKYGF